MKVTRFDPKDDLIIVEGRVWGPSQRQRRPLRLVLDTGAAETIQVHVQDLPDGWNIEGLIGLSFLRQFNYEIRSLEGRLLVDRATP